MKEWGIFSEDGLVEGQFYSLEEAQKAIEERYSKEDDLTVAEVCPDHSMNERHSCEECLEEEDED